MTPLRIIRRLHAPLACLAIACVVSVGCRSRQETVHLGEPAQAYRADNGAVLLGYNVQREIKPGDAGWHWLIIEPATAKLMLQPLPPGAVDERERAVAVDYKGWSSNARLVPPLVEPGLSDDTPPVVGDGGLTELRFTWDNELRGPRLLDKNFALLPVIRVSPDAAMLEVWEYDRELMLDVLKVTAIVAGVVGLILLGGSASFSNH